MALEKHGAQSCLLNSVNPGSCQHRKSVLYSAAQSTLTVQKSAPPTHLILRGMGTSAIAEWFQSPALRRELCNRTRTGNEPPEQKLREEV